MSKTIKEFKCGDSAEFKHKISADDVRKFVELTGDDNPLHVNKAFAERTSFKGVVTHGMLSAAFVSTMIGRYIPGNGALWISQNFEFLLPVRIDDELTIFSEVIGKHEMQSILILKTKITNQRKQLVLEGVGKVKVLELEVVESAHEEIDEPKVVIITGAGKGIGAATAKYLANKKYRVVVNYAKDQEAAELVVTHIRNMGGEAFSFQADVCDIHAVKSMVAATVKNFGTVSALVHGATSKIIASDFHTLDWDDVQQHIETQLHGAFNCVQAILAEFHEKRRGVVVMLGSIVADNVPSLKWTGYTLAKAALHSLTKSLALEYGPAGIRFNLVSPGMTETGLIADIPEKARLLAKMQTPLRKLAKPSNVAEAIGFLLSDEASHITGENLRVCGGGVML